MLKKNLYSRIKHWYFIYKYVPLHVEILVCYSERYLS